MKRKAIAFLFFVIFLLSAYLVLPAVLLSIAKENLKKTFPGASVEISGLKLNGLSSLMLSGLEISKKNNFALGASQIEARYNLLSLMKGSIDEISVKEVNIDINTPQRSITRCMENLNLREGKGLLIKRFGITGLAVKVNSKDVTLEAESFLEIQLADRQINLFSLKMPNLKAMGIDCEGLAVDMKGSRGDLSIAKLGYNDLSMAHLRSKLRLAGKNLFLEGFQCEALDGALSGDIKVILDKQPEIYINLVPGGLDIKTMIHDFKLEDKLEMSGRLSGKMGLKLDSSGINLLEGKLNTLNPGGTLVIKDTLLLENVAKGSQQPIDVLVEGFKNYRYNNGNISLTLSGNNLIIEMSLEGDTGKRKLSIVVHGFNLVNLMSVTSGK